MAIVGIGSRSSPIVIDDDDDDPPIPLTTNADSSSSSLVKGIAPQQLTPADIAPARDTTPVRQEKPDQLTSGIGYSMLVRMGFKPGHGLGVNLEGMTSPIKACIRPKALTAAGIGVNDVISRKELSKAAPNAGPAATRSQPTAPVSEHAHGTTSSTLPIEASTIPTRKPRNAIYRRCPTAKIPCDSSSPTGNNLGSSGLVSTHGDGLRKVNTAVKTSTELHLDPHHSTSPQGVGNTHPLASQVPPSSNLTFPLQFFFPELFHFQSFPLHLPPPPVDFRDSAPVNAPLGSVNPPSRPLPTLPSRPPSPSQKTSSISYVTKSKGKGAVIGESPDDAKIGGTRGSFPKKIEPPPITTCSLVMETLPRKFRTDSFILDWLSQFTFEPRRYELVEGKAFFEFKTVQDANIAWKSPRMGGLGGLLSVRLFWYRVLPQPALKATDTIGNVNATGTKENSVRPPPPRVPCSSTDDRSGFKVDLVQIPTQKTASLPPSPTYPTVIGEATVDDKPPTGASRSNSNSQTPQGGDSTVPSPPVTTRSLTACKTSSDPLDNHMDADCTMRDRVPGLNLGTSALPIVISPSSSPALSPSSAPSSSRISSSVFSSFSPEVINSAVTTTSVDHQAPPALNEGPMQQSNLTAVSSHMETDVQGIEIEKADGTPLGADDLMDTSDTAALVKERDLRRMVLQSRKRKLLERSSIEEPTPATSSTTTSGNALQDLAVHFIADAIARPRPAKIVKITPSATAMAAWGKRLEKHVESSRAIMAKIQSTQSKAEKNRLMGLLREKNRRIEMEKTALYACPVEQVVPVSPWPDSHPDQGILELSDTDDDDDEGDYDTDDDDMVQ